MNKDPFVRKLTLTAGTMYYVTIPQGMIRALIGLFHTKDIKGSQPACWQAGNLMVRLRISARSVP